jgi:hypothetical protein
VAALGVLGGAALADAGPDDWPLRGLLFLVPLLPCGRALWILLPGLGGIDALRWSGDAWSLRRHGRWFPACCVARVEVHQAGWWLVFRGDGGRAWVWVGMRPGEAGAGRELARALRSGPRESSAG